MPNNTRRERFHRPANATQPNERDAHEQDSPPSADHRLERLSEHRRREVVAVLDMHQMALADFQRKEPIPGVLVR